MAMDLMDGKHGKKEMGYNESSKISTARTDSFCGKAEDIIP